MDIVHVIVKLAGDITMDEQTLRAYKQALKVAWNDREISSDEAGMIDNLRESFQISMEDHIRIEMEVRSELKKEKAR